MLTVSPSHFQNAPASPALAPGHVHLWRLDLDAPVPDDGASLDTAEWVRARRFHFERDRRRFIAGRSLLRRILGLYLDLDPQEVPLTTGPHGKPELSGMLSSLRFNLSHSEGLMLLALTHARDIGVDVEAIRDSLPFEMLAEHYFEPEDAWRVRTQPIDERPAIFFDVWTSTEARLKAAGIGLAHGPTAPCPERWSMLRLSPAAGYTAALAVEGGSFQLACWSWRH